MVSSSVSGSIRLADFDTTLSEAFSMTIWSKKKKKKREDREEK